MSDGIGLSAGKRKQCSVVTGLILFVCTCLVVPVEVSGDEGESGESLPASSETTSVVGITAPYRTATMATLQQGRILRLPVEEGQRVRSGEVVIILDDDLQRVRAELRKAEAESTLRVTLARARMERARKELERLVQLRGSAFASSKELTDAESEAEVRRLEHQIALLEHDQAGREYQHEKLLLEQHRVVAPFGGYVSERLKQVGETVEEREGILTLVQLDPLEVSVDCPATLAPFIHEGDRAWVHPTDRHWPPRQGEVVLANRVADPGSQTFKVKLTVDNADGAWIAGLKVIVDFAIPPERAAHHRRPASVPPDKIAVVNGRAERAAQAVEPAD